MNTRTILYVIAAIVLLGGTTYGYFVNDTVKGIVDEYVLGSEEPASVLAEVPETWVYVVADPTDMGTGQFSIPHVDTAFVGATLDMQFANGGGNFWLGYIDRNSRNNPVISFKVPRHGIRPTSTARRNDETMSEFETREQSFKETIVKWGHDSVAFVERYQRDRLDFLLTVQDFLMRKVYVKGPELSRSDVHTALSAAGRTIEAAPSTHEVSAYLIAFSDLVHNVKGTEPTVLPATVGLISVNSAPGSSAHGMEGVQEVESGQRALELVQYQVSPLN